MNDRIKELAKEAGYNDQIYEISKEGLEKFAALIVSECSTISTATCASLKDDDEDAPPGYKTILNLYMITLRLRLADTLGLKL